MSGTSFDGLDIALCHFFLVDNEWTFEIPNAETLTYSKEWIETLKSAENPNSKFEEISITYGNYIGEKINEFILKHSIKEVDLIASHGHTLFHEPAKGITFQAGNGAAIFQKTQIPTICNFRKQDVTLGGQGAPLVPIGDLNLFKNYQTCVNLGGFANLSLKSNNSIRAWDICPVNYVLNKLTNEIGLDYDDKGQIAASHKIDSALLKKFNNLSFYETNPPKSLAREWVSIEILPILNNSICSLEQKIATFTEHAAIQIACSIPQNSNTLFSGGGTFNTYLMDRIKFHNPSIEITIPSKSTIEYKEALIFAFIGTLRVRNETNIFASVTGASKDHCAGDVFTK